MGIYYLADHIHAAIADGQLIFLDLKKDRYFALPPEATIFAESLVSERQIAINSILHEDKYKNNILGIISELRNYGALTSGVNHKIHRAKNVNVITQEYSDAFFDENPKITVKIIINFCQALVFGVVGKKIMGIYWMTKHASKFRVRERSHNINVENTIYSFRYIRSFFYTSRNHCYFDCAVFVYFLKLQGFSPDWVFGIQVAPFKAHCWVQLDNALLTDELSHVMFYYRIAAF